MQLELNRVSPRKPHLEPSNPGRKCRPATQEKGNVWSSKKQPSTSKGWDCSLEWRAAKMPPPPSLLLASLKCYAQQKTSSCLSNRPSGQTKAAKPNRNNRLCGWEAYKTVATRDLKICATRSNPQVSHYKATLLVKSFQQGSYRFQRWHHKVNLCNSVQRSSNNPPGKSTWPIFSRVSADFNLLCFVWGN